MNKKFFLLGLIFIVAAIAAVFLWVNQKPPATNFEECAAAGNPIMLSSPARCRADGQTFTEDIGNELEKQDLIQIEKPRPKDSVKSPLAITGRARGSWFSEASFPIKIYDENGKLLGTTVASATSDWMTSEFVGFQANLEFEKPITKKGELVLEKDNPSGLPENDDKLEVPIKFE